jgi:integrase/recombinase XerD
MSTPPKTASSMPVAAWPQRDQEAWSAAFEPGEVASYWSDETRRAVRGGYGRYLTWLHEQGRLDAAAQPAERVTTELVSSYISALRLTQSEFSAANRIEQLGNALRGLAPSWDWRWLQQQASQIRTAAKRDRDFARARLSPTAHEVGDEAAEAVPCSAAKSSLPLADWPESDRLAWVAALQPEGLFAAGSVARDWGEATRGLAVNGYGRFLAWLSAEGKLDPASTPASRATKENLRAYLGHLQGTVADFTACSYIQQVGNALRAMVAGEDWCWIQRAADRLRAEAQPVRDKRARIQSPERLVALGKSLIAQGEDLQAGTPVNRAVLYRDGLMIAFLACRAIRRRNLTAISGGHHLTRRGTDWWLQFEPAENKGKILLEFPFPPELTPFLERYLTVHRPVLLHRGQRRLEPVTALWISKHGGPMGEAAITHQVRQRTAAAFGLPISPHMFRDCLATAVAISAPAEIDIVPVLLGQRSAKTAERHYNLAGSVNAVRRYASVIRQWEDGNR